MSDSGEAFEGRAKRAGFHDFKVADNGCYADVFLQHFYYGWEAAFDSCSNAKPFTWCFTDVNGKPKELTDDPVHRCPEDLRIYTPLYTHPAISKGARR